MSFVATLLDTRSVVKTTGVTLDASAEQIETAFDPTHEHPVAGHRVRPRRDGDCGAALAKVLIVASALAWQVPVQRHKAIRVVGIVVGTTIGVALLSVLVNRLRDSAGIAVAWLLFLLVLVYIVAWLVLTLALPRASRSRRGASRRGPVQRHTGGHGGCHPVVPPRSVPPRLRRCTAPRGSTVVTLGWFFILGGIVVLSMTINAVVYERIGSVSIFIFGLPLGRALPRRWPWVAHLIGLDQQDRVRDHEDEA